MDAKQIRQLDWCNFTNWHNIPETHRGKNSQLYTSKKDLENFVENIFRDIARQLNIEYSKIEQILKEENAPFYNMLDEVYKKYSGLRSWSEELETLENMLRIPDVSSVPKKKCNVEKILKDFSTLTEVEKVEVLQRLKLISVQIRYIDD